MGSISKWKCKCVLEITSKGFVPPLHKGPLPTKEDSRRFSLSNVLMQTQIFHRSQWRWVFLTTLLNFPGQIYHWGACGGLFMEERVCCICFDFSRYYSRCLNKQIKTFSQMIEICSIYFFLKFLHLHISYTYFKSFTILHDFYYIKTI